MLYNMISLVGFLLIGGGVLGGMYSVMQAVRSEKPLVIVPFVVAVILGIMLTMIQGFFFYAEPGYSYLVQYPNGTQKAVLTPGYHVSWLGEVIPFKKYVTIAFVGAEDPTNFSGVRSAQSIRFNDSVTADVRMTARFQLPEGEDLFLKMALAFRSQENLINSSLVPIAQEAMRNSGRMFSAQEYIGGQGGDFENAVLDQIRNGIYLLDVKEEKTFGGETDAIGQGGATIQQDQTVRVSVNIRRDAEGQELRKDAEDNPLRQFGLILAQANIQEVDPDSAFKDKLAEQREAAAQVSIERQLTRQEEEKKKRIIAQGEAEKAAKKIELEKAQIEQVTAAETEGLKAEQDKKRRMTEAESAKSVAEIEKEQRQLEAEQDKIRRLTEAETAKELAEVEKAQKEIELEIAKLEADRITALAEAEAAKRRANFEADNALEQRLQAWVEINKAYATALNNKQLVPSIIIGGNGTENGTSANDLISLLVASTAQDLGLELGLTEPVSTSTSAFVPPDTQ